MNYYILQLILNQGPNHSYKSEQEDDERFLKNTSVILDLMIGTVSMKTDDCCLSFRDKVLSSQTFFSIS